MTLTPQHDPQTASALVTLHEVAPPAAANLALGGDGGFDWIEGGPEEGTRIGAGLVAKAEGEGTYVPGWGVYVIARAADGLAVGAMGFHTAPVDGRVEIGYDLVSTARGHGYATAALRSLTAWALAQAGVTTVYARTEPDNTPSQRVLQRAGFRLTGRTDTECTYELSG
ncbi:GNAT family N-acetyltransferase [Streptomyces cavernicola]|uniref:GNAT family protein n=1 Tax=Streptomyces cavernicola TaxID=3043613 RepID=A0ABT6SNX1_9ACTN|nr:GNAT family protein [Streptomyces sp. B-S-A6]MDI3409133.1 GNAT family protein [Streptomyces sp. B-S-A6]